MSEGIRRILLTKRKQYLADLHVNSRFVLPYPDYLHNVRCNCGCNRELIDGTKVFSNGNSRYGCTKVYDYPCARRLHLC